jgi:FkbM family methyltransferase
MNPTSFRRCRRTSGLARSVMTSVHTFGYLSLVLSRLVGQKGVAFSFEPDPRNRDVLQTNVAMNALRNVEVHPVALSDELCRATLATFAYSSVSHLVSPNTPSDATLIDVPLMSIDEFVYRDGHPPPSFLKIDVEGAEYRVLRGATRVLREHHPVVVAEVRRGIVWQEISELMHSLGYTPQVLGRDGRESTSKSLFDVLYLPSIDVD